MALNLTTLAGKMAKTEVPFMGQTCKITYDPMYLTQENVDKSTVSEDAFVTFFCALVKNWDVTKSNKKVPLTPAGIKTVPMLLLRAIYGAIMQVSEGDIDEGKTSSDS